MLDNVRTLEKKDSIIIDEPKININDILTRNFNPEDGMFEI